MAIYSFIKSCPFWNKELAQHCSGSFDQHFGFSDILNQNILWKVYFLLQ